MIIIFKNKLLKISLASLLLILFPVRVMGDEKSENSTNLNIESPSAILIDGESGKILFEKNSQEVRSATSLMKIMNLKERQIRRSLIKLKKYDYIDIEIKSNNKTFITTKLNKFLDQRTKNNKQTIK